MTQPLTFHVPGKPMSWKRARLGKRGIPYTPAEVRQREQSIGYIALQEMAGQPAFSGPVRMAIGCFFEPPKSWPKKRQAAALNGEIRPTGKPDCDNLAKLIKDALNAIVYRDDALVTELVVRKEYGPQALTVVTVEALA